MNNDNLTTEYKKKWEQVTLSDSSRLRMEGTLLEYARFHAVSDSAVPVKSPFVWLRMKSVQAVLALVLVVSAGAALYLGGDNGATAPLATDVALTTPEAAPASTTQAETVPPSSTLAIETSQDNFYTTPEADDTASDADMNARSIATKESADAVSDEMFTTMLSQGVVNIDDYRADVTKREKTYRALITKYDTQIADDVRTELIAKLNTTLALATDAEGKEESEARPLLDKGMTLVGEIESTLSILGSVTVEEGIIIDVDFTSNVEPAQ